MPAEGPIFLTVPGVSDVPIAAAVPPALAVGAPVKFQWPRPYVLSGLWLSTRDGLPVSLAGLRLRIQDEGRNELVTDGQGFRSTMSGLSIMGRSPRWMPFRWEVRSGDRWIFQLSSSLLAIVTPSLLLRVET